jgi:rare lipoprotein A
MALLALALVAGAALPAAAESGDSRTRNWSEGGPKKYYRGEQTAPRRAARAHRYYDADEEAAPRRRSYAAHKARRQGAHRHAARSGKSTRGHRVAQRRGKGHKAVAQRKHQAQKPAVAATKPEGQPAQKGAAPAEKKATAPETAPQTAPKSAAPKAQAARPSGGGQHGVASFYWQPQRVAAGGWFNPNAMTAAHKTLPFGTRVRVTHQGNGRSVEVVINDRGPYIAGRIIDLSKAAASIIGMTGQGIARVAVEVLGR